MSVLKSHTIEVEGVFDKAKEAYRAWLEKNLKNLAEIPTVEYIDVSERVQEEQPNPYYEIYMGMYNSKMERYNQRMAEIAAESKPKKQGWLDWLTQTPSKTIYVHQLPNLPEEPEKTWIAPLFKPKFKIYIIYKTI